MFLRRVYFFTLFIILTKTSIFATHTGNRYFIFLEKPESYVTKQRSLIGVSVFYAMASTAYKRYGGTCGIPELWGFYDLKDVITSLQTVKGAQYDPIYEVTGTHEFDGQSLKFQVTSKIDTAGLMLEYEQNLKFAHLKNFTFGIWLPIMQTDVISRFEFKRKDYENNYKPLTDTDVINIDKIRRLTHKYIGFAGTNTNRNSLGDLDIHLRWNYFAEYILLLRSIDLNIQGGIIAPTGNKMDIDYPASIPFMNDGHWGVYLDCLPEIELKQDLKVGLILGFLHQFKNTQTRRLAVGKEPTIYSALIGRVEINPGFTFKFSPYLTLENLTDGLHLQIRYTYLRHDMDKWYDERSDKSIKSYLNPSESYAGLTQEEIKKNISYKSELSKWRAHYITFQAIYDSKLALKNWFMEPKFFASYDIPINGNGFCKTHQFTIGAQFFF